LVLWSFTVVAVKMMKYDRNILKKIIFYWLIIAAITAYFSLIGYFSVNELDPSHRISFGNIGLNAISISMGYIFILGISSFGLFKRDKVKKLIMGISLLIIALLIIRLGTRSVLWGIPLSILIVDVLVYKQKSWKSLTLVIFVVWSSVYLINNTGYVSGRLAERILLVSGVVITENTRADLWETGINWWGENPMGSGAGNEEKAYINNSYVGGYESHSVFISALIQLGIPGVVLVVFSLLLTIVKGFNIKNKELLFSFFTLLTFFLIQISKGSFLQTRLFWQPLTILLILLNHQRYRISMKSPTSK